MLPDDNSWHESTRGSKDPEILRDGFQIYGRGDVGVFLEFKTTANEVIMAQVGISLVSVEQARLNLDTVLARFGWDFDATRAHASETWNNLLSKIEVEGESESDKVKFSTNFYRAYAGGSLAWR